MMSKPTRSLRWIAICLTAAAVVATGYVGSVSTAGAASGGTSKGVVLNVSASPAGPISQNFNPYSETAAFNFLGATSMIYETLLQFNSLKEGVVHPWLATSYAWSNGGTTLTFQKGVLWSE